MTLPLHHCLYSFQGLELQQHLQIPKEAIENITATLYIYTIILTIYFRKK